MRTLLTMLFLLAVVPAEASLCDDPVARTEAFWRRRTEARVAALARDAVPATVNAAVTMSYLALFRTRTRSPAAAFLSYVYANASHHLGRLVRFTTWPAEHPLAARDRELVKGTALRRLAETAPGALSPRLMRYSLDLYKELAWALDAAVTCGDAAARALVPDEHRRSAFAAESVADFLRHFIAFEQTYLQGKMYRDVLIAAAARARVLDEMRFISFDGEEHLSFRAWCDRRDCGTSSYDLANRIAFDVAAVGDELAVTGATRTTLEARLRAARVEATALVFLGE